MLLVMLYPFWGTNVYGGRNTIDETLQTVLYVGREGTCENEVMFGLEDDAGW